MATCCVLPCVSCHVFIYPNEPWNYAIVGDGNPEYVPGSETKWDVNAGVPVIRVDACLVMNWKLVVQDKIASYNSVYKCGKCLQKLPCVTGI